MSGSPISGSDPAKDAVFNRLWTLSVDIKRGRDVQVELVQVNSNGLSPLEEKVAAAVKAHLMAAAGLIRGFDHTKQTWLALATHWDEVIAEFRDAPTSLRPRSHAFHMRLASKYAEYYRSFDQNALEHWVQAARFKSEFLAYIGVHRDGSVGRAVELADNLARQWRATLSVRLPGLYVIERTASAWADANQDADRAASLMERANQGVGRLAPYADDEPTLWRPPRSIENTARFAFAATPLPLTLMT